MHHHTVLARGNHSGSTSLLHLFLIGTQDLYYRLAVLAVLIQGSAKEGSIEDSIIEALTAI